MSFLKAIFGSKSLSDKIQILQKPAYHKAITTGSKVQLVDVRTAREYNKGHIKGAKNFDFFNSNQFKNGFESLDKSKPVYLYCQSGNRSQKAASRLVAMGFEEIIDLAGGYSAWSRN